MKETCCFWSIVKLWEGIFRVGSSIKSKNRSSFSECWDWWCFIVIFRGVQWCFWRFLGIFGLRWRFGGLECCIRGIFQRGIKVFIFWRWCWVGGWLRFVWRFFSKDWWWWIWVIQKRIWGCWLFVWVKGSCWDFWSALHYRGNFKLRWNWLTRLVFLWEKVRLRFCLQSVWHGRNRECWWNFSIQGKDHRKWEAKS